MAKERIYIAIDLKSFYASVECVERGLDPLTTNLVVADESRTEKTICLAVSPSLKAYGIPGRARLFEVVQKVKEVNQQRRISNNYKPFDHDSYDADELKKKDVELSYIVATPRMNLYKEYSNRIVAIYLNYVSIEDIHVYSIDEVFMDVTDYLHSNGMTPHEMAMTMIKDVLSQTGITATAGIGTNMYLCKIAMDIEAKHVEADKDGVRIAELNEMTYRQKLWDHTPLTDFWRVGKGIATKLYDNGMYTMGDVARRSLMEGPLGENLLYKLFGINAELLIDHAWGWEPTTIKEIKDYRPENTSLSSGQVLQEPYPYDKARIIVREMMELLALDLVDKGLVTDQVVLTIGYDTESVKGYKGEITTDRYGRQVPKHAHGTGNVGRYTASTKLLMETVMEVFQRVVDDNLLVRRVNISVNHLMSENEVSNQAEQISLFDNNEDVLEKEEELKKEKALQKAMLSIQKKFGKNAILKGVNLQEGATTIERNGTVGGHKA